jgi:hypothetical protein
MFRHWRDQSSIPLLEEVRVNEGTAVRWPASCWLGRLCEKRRDVILGEKEFSLLYSSTIQSYLYFADERLSAHHCHASRSLWIACEKRLWGGGGSTIVAAEEEEEWTSLSEFSPLPIGSRPLSAHHCQQQCQHEEEEEEAPLSEMKDATRGDTIVGDVQVQDKFNVFFRSEWKKWNLSEAHKKRGCIKRAFILYQNTVGLYTKWDF